MSSITYSIQKYTGLGSYNLSNSERFETNFNCRLAFSGWFSTKTKKLKTSFPIQNLYFVFNVSCQWLHLNVTYTVKYVYLGELAKEMYLKTENLGPEMRIKDLNINSMGISGLHNQSPISLTAFRSTQVWGVAIYQIESVLNQILTVD